MRFRPIACCVAVLAFVAAGRAEAAMGIIDEAKLGILAHDVPIGGDHKEQGADANGELLFVSPAFLAPIWAPRPHVGFTVNSAGKNSYAYAGLTWTVNVADTIFVGLGVGGAIHDGPNTSSVFSRNHKGLGTRLLFHESVEIGYRMTRTWDIAAFLDHVSNASLGSRNPGLTNLGVRLGYTF
jgi:lipid A 3-O-deacylase